MSITAITVLTPAVEYPVSLSEAKSQIRVTHSAEDEHIQALIAAATAWAQDYTGRVFIDTQVQYKLDCFTDAIRLPGGVVSAVNDIDYTDADGALQVLTGPTSSTPGTDYQETLQDDEQPILYPARESSWPSTQSGLKNAVAVDYQVGWSSSGEVPENIKHAIKFKVADLYTIRDSVDGSKSAAVASAENLLFPYIIQSC